MALAHFTVEELHPERFAFRCMPPEVFDRTEKVAVGEELDGNSQVVAGFQQGLANAMITRFDENDVLGSVLLEGAGELKGKAAGVLRGIEFGVVHCPALFGEVVAEVTHGGEEQGDALRVGPNVSGFLGDLGHPDPVLVRIGVSESGGVGIELVAKDENESAHGWFHAWSGMGPLSSAGARLDRRAGADSVGG